MNTKKGDQTCVQNYDLISYTDAETWQGFFAENSNTRSAYCATAELICKPNSVQIPVTIPETWASLSPKWQPPPCWILKDGIFSTFRNVKKGDFDLREKKLS